MPGAHTLHPTILREYDIRGLVGETLSAPDAHAVGRAFASLAVKKFGGAPKICVAYDGRLSSPELEAALVDGLTKAAPMWSVSGAARRRCSTTPPTF